MATVYSADVYYAEDAECGVAKNVQVKEAPDCSTLNWKDQVRNGTDCVADNYGDYSTGNCTTNPLEQLQTVCVGGPYLAFETAYNTYDCELVNASRATLHAHFADGECYYPGNAQVTFDASGLAVLTVFS